MPKLLTIRNSGKIRSEIQYYFSDSEDARFVRRLDVIALICNGYALTYVASLFSINATTVQRWVHRLNTVGFPGLKDEPGRGRRFKLKEGDRLKLKEDLKRTPKHFGYEQTRWDGKLLPGFCTQITVASLLRQFFNAAEPDSRGTSLTNVAFSAAFFGSNLF
jgi:transposase